MKRDWSSSGGRFVTAQFALLLLVFFVPELFSRFAFPLWLAWAVIVFGVVLMLVAASGLGRNLTSLPKPRDDGTLVTTGVFGVVRHPIYSALMLIAFGSALARGSVTALAVAVALAVLLEFKSRLEESLLSARFAEYASYRARVKKFVPGVY
jgi:protein-S-isoprenylcysteine O-methyltransferase Ste14